MKDHFLVLTHRFILLIIYIYISIHFTKNVTSGSHAVRIVLPHISTRGQTEITERKVLQHKYILLGATAILLKHLTFKDKQYQ